MARKRNTNFRLGLNRLELIEAAQLFGKSEKTAKKDSTKRLEEYLVNKFGGRGFKVPQFTQQELRDIRDATQNYGLHDSLDLINRRIKRMSGNHDEENYLRLTIAREFSGYYDGIITKRMVDELLARLPLADRNETISGLKNHEIQYQMIFEEYIEELENE